MFPKEGSGTDPPIGSGRGGGVTTGIGMWSPDCA